MTNKEKELIEYIAQRNWTEGSISSHCANLMNQVAKERNPSAMELAELLEKRIKTVIGECEMLSLVQRLKAKL